MTAEEANRTIHEAMGLCWHIWEYIDVQGLDIICLKCHSTATWYSKSPNPDYTSREGFWDAWEWAQEQPWFDQWLLDRGLGRLPISTVKNLVDPKFFATTLAEFLKERDK